MRKGDTTQINTLTVTGSQTVVRPDGRAAILLYTSEEGAIAFEVDQNAIDALRRELAAAEEFLRQKPSRA